MLAGGSAGNLSLSYFVYHIQLNKYIKLINGHSPTDHRISWTTVGLNIFLEIFRDIYNLRIGKRDVGVKYMMGTLQDVNKLWLMIHQKLGVVLAGDVREWSADFWYEERKTELSKTLRPSKLLEKSHRQVIRLYFLQQNNVWDNAEPMYVGDDNPQTERPQDADDYMDVDNNQINQFLQVNDDSDSSSSDEEYEEVDLLKIQDIIKNLDDQEENTSDRESDGDDEDLPDITDY